VRLPRLFLTTTFRLALIYLGLFLILVLFLLGFVYWTTSGIADRQIDDTIEAEITGLAEQYRLRGLGGLSDVVAERSRNQRYSLYLLTGPGGFSLAGNLNAWPEGSPADANGWFNFSYRRPVGGEVETHNARARHLLLGNDFDLLVGRDVEERHRIDQVLRASIAWAVALTLGLGLLGGIIFSRNVLRRIEAITRASRDIMEGDLRRRLPRSGSDDEIDRLAGSLNDMLEEIERLVTSMREVTDNIAHDLRSPLTRLRNRIEVTLLHEATPAEYRAVLDETVSEVAGLLDTFNGLLAIARAEAGRPEGTPEPFDLSAAVTDMVELYAPVAEEKSLILSGDVAPGLSLIGFRQLMSQALGNLIDNAIKYTPSNAPGGGRIAVVLKRQGSAGCELIVADTGPGIPEADRDRVLDRFVRLEASRNSPGSGLGLSLVRAVARLHGAELILADNLPGLRVILRFPPDSIDGAGQ
jgi:signal transduction histidine kinase